MITTTIDYTAVQDALEGGGFVLDVTTGHVLAPGEASGWLVGIPGTERVLGRDVDSHAVASGLNAVLSSVHPDYGTDAYAVGYWVAGQGYALSAATVHNVAASSALLIGDLRGLDAITSLDTGDTLTIPRIP